ncbi:Fc.00g073260.m01.CDS01 [Cosmosporella sp. VM-42]
MDLDSLALLPPRKEQMLERVGLYFNLPERAIICIECGFAIDPKRVVRHPGDKHNIARSARRGLKPLISSLSLLDIDQLPRRPDGSNPHPHLAIQKASACKHCGLRSISEKVLQLHISNDHRDKLQFTAQRKRYWMRDHIQEGLWLQSWAARDIQRSWIVSGGEALDQRFFSNHLLLEACPDPIKDLAQQLCAEEHTHLAVQRGAQRAYEPGMPTTSTLMTNWMRRTGWQAIFGDARRDILVSLVQLPCTIADQALHLGTLGDETLYSPARDERRLVLVVAALDRLLDQCGDTVRRTDVCVRRWLRGRFPDHPYKAPFELVSSAASEQLYRKEMKRCLCFWLRLWRLPSPTIKKIIGRGLAKTQCQALKQLWLDPVWEAESLINLNSIHQGYSEENGYNDSEEEWEEEESDADDDDDDETKSDIEDGEVDWSTDDSASHQSSDDGLDAPPDDPAVDVILRFCYATVTEDFLDGTASSTMLIYFSAVRGLSSPNGDEYLPPHRFTPILSRLIYCIRLISLEAVLPCLSHNYIGIASRPRYQHLETLNALRQCHLCDGTLSPMGEFLSLLSYGNVLRRSQGPAFLFEWSADGEVLSWDGSHHLSMENFRGLAHRVFEAASAQSKRLMYNWEPADIDLGNIRDRISTTTPGYSFLSDSANKLSDSYLDLFLRACISPIDGLLQRQGKDQSTWDLRAAQAYLDAHDELIKTLMVLCNIDGGQCSRISELLALEHCNTSSRQRGICIWGARICSISRHHKARLTTNKEFYVARFFSPRVSQLIFRYLVYIRPVSKMILRKCFHYIQDITLLFHPISQMGSRIRPWTTATFTNKLRHYCNEAPGVPPGIGVQLYRQISIAITERHLRAVATPFNRFDDVTGAADADVAYAWQSGHRPTQRYSTYGLDGAFPDQLQPALLRIYSKISSHWHVFLWGDRQGIETIQGEIEVEDTMRIIRREGQLPYEQRQEHAESLATLIEPYESQGQTENTLSDSNSNIRAALTPPNDDTGSESSIRLGDPGSSGMVEPDLQSLNADASQYPSIGPFKYLAEWNLVKCNIGLVASEVIGHTKHHGEIGRQQAKAIDQMVKANPSIIPDQAGLKEWSGPSPYIKPIAQLKPPKQDMLGCDECTYVVQEPRRMQEHCRIEHGWVNDWKKGGDVIRRAQEERQPVPWRKGVRCQRLCNWGHGKQWFEVGRGANEPIKPGPIEGNEWDAVAQAFSRMHEEDKQAFETEAKAEIKQVDDKNEMDRWLRRCRWADHLQYVRKAQLQKTLEPVRDNEPVLQRIYEVLDHMLENTYYAANQYQPRSAELFKIKHKEASVTTSTPFQGLMEMDSWARYKAH